MIGPFYEVFPDSEQARVRDGACRYQLLQEDADSLVEDWIGQYVPPDRTSTWGPPDTSKVPIVTVARAMSTPGHYGREPRIVGDVAGLAELLRAAGWASKMQSVEYLAYGMNTCGLLPSWSDDLGRLVLAVCPSHLLWFDEHPDDPTVAIVQRRLQVRSVYGEDCLAWDVWDVSDPSSPVFRIVKADRRGEYGDDITEEVTGRGPLVGDDYPYRDAAGRPFAPVVLYRTHDDSSMWSWHRGKGAFRGSLMAILYNSHTGKAARDSVSQGGIMVDAEPVGGNVGYDNSGRGVVSIDFEAGDILHYRSTGASQPMYKELKPGANLTALSAFAAQYSSSVAVEMGVTPTDAVRVGANPMSGVAIHLTNAARREEQHRIAPLMRAADLELFARVASLATMAGDTVPPVGYDVDYYEIPMSPAEEKDRRDATTWAIESGLQSPVDAYLERHPSLTRDEARAELARIRREIDELGGTDE
jgi:hypothetical protein